MTSRKENRDWLEEAREVLSVEIEGIEAVRDSLGEDFRSAVELFLSCKGRVVITGLGKSGLVGRKIAATLSSTGTPSFFLHPVEGAHGDLGMIRTEDAVLAISNSGETDELNSIIPVLKSLGTSVVAMTANPESTLGSLSDAVIMVKVPREACPIGLAPTTSTTAALAVGDALAVCLMRAHSFGQVDFKRFHPGGVLGGRLSLAVGQLMHTSGLPAAGDDQSLSEALEILNRGGLGLVVLVDEEGRVTGVLSDGDVRRVVCAGPFDSSLPVSEFMTADPRCAHTGQTAAQVLDLMETKQITVMPVLGPEGSFEGIIHLHDILGKGRLKFSS